MVTAVCGLLLLLSVLVCTRIHRGSLFSPLTVFFTWNFVLLAMYDVGLRYGYFQLRLSFHAELLYIGVFFCLFVGYLTVVLGGHRVRLGGPSDEVHPSLCGDVRAEMLRIAKVLILAYAVGLGWKYMMLVRTFGNPFANLRAIRLSLIEGRFSYPIVLTYMTLAANMAVLNLGVVFAFVKSHRRRVVGLILVTFALLILDDLSIGARACPRLFIMLVSAAFVSYAVLGRKVTVRHVIAAGVCAVALMLLLGVVVYFRTSGQVQLVEGIMVSSIYSNLVGNIPAFSYFVEHPWRQILPGYYTLGGVYQYIDRVLQRLFDLSFLPKAVYDHYDPARYADISSKLLFNTTNDLTSVYMDFGDIGVLVYGYLVGVVASYAFMRVERRRMLFDVQFCALIVTAIVMNVRGIYFSAIGFWATIFLIVMQHLYLGAGRAEAVGHCGRRDSEQEVLV